MNRDDEIVRDGQVVRVPLTIMDGAANIARAGLVRHSPGYAVLSDAERLQRIERQQTKDAQLTDSWRSPLPGRTTASTPTADSNRSPRDRYISRVANAWKNPCC